MGNEIEMNVEYEVPTMTPTQTSLLAYKLVRPTIPQRQREVLVALKELGGHGTMHDVAFKLLRPLHALSGRFSELERKGYIKKCGSVTKYGYTRSIYWLKVFPIDLTESCDAPIAIGQGRAGSCQNITSGKKVKKNRDGDRETYEDTIKRLLGDSVGERK